MKAWDGVLPDLIQDRAKKPRRVGVTMVLDRCKGLSETEDLLELTGDYVDHIKLSFGTSVLLDDGLLRRKIEIIRDRGIDVYPGGTLFEIALFQGVCVPSLMLVEVGIIPPQVGRWLLNLLLELHALPLAQFPLDPALSDVFSNRERWLAARDREAAGWLSTGRARREATTVAYHLAVRSRLLALVETTVVYLRALLAQAEAHVATVMPDYTYLQPAQPQRSSCSRPGWTIGPRTPLWDGRCGWLCQQGRRGAEGQWNSGELDSLRQQK